MLDEEYRTVSYASQSGGGPQLVICSKKRPGGWCAAPVYATKGRRGFQSRGLQSRQRAQGLALHGAAHRADKIAGMREIWLTRTPYSGRYQLQSRERRTSTGPSRGAL
ncbi:hypothetical protein N5P37_008743 [Trichoderma harzianum]|nr:hypothetical protein N5P37_008743 [Trichoderma harzianum]